jgi:hypothetical protein
MKCLESRFGDAVNVVGYVLLVLPETRLGLDLDVREGLGLRELHAISCAENEQLKEEG